MNRAPRLAVPLVQPDRSPTVPFHQAGPAVGRPRILLISYHFPPAPSPRGARWEEFTRLAAERGWGVDVVMCDPSGVRRPDWSRVEALPAGTRLYHVPAFRLWVEHLAIAVAAVARSPSSGGRPSSLSRAELRWPPRSGRELYRAYRSWLEHARGRRWAGTAASVAGGVIVPGMHRVVVTSGPPHMAHLAGVELARRTGLPFVIDMRAPWSLLPRRPEATAHPLWWTLAARHEARCVEAADLVVTDTPRRKLLDAMDRWRPAARHTGRGPASSAD